MKKPRCKIEIVGLAGWREVVPSKPGQAATIVIMSFAARWIASEPVLNDELDDFKWLAARCAGRSQADRRPAGMLKAASRPISA